MFRLMTFADAVVACGVGLVAYKAFELGPYDAAIWLGRCFGAFAAAALGHV